MKKETDKLPQNKALNIGVIIDSTVINQYVKYKCNLCGKTVSRDSNKKWIKSMCDETGKTGRLMKIEFNSKFIEKLCKEYLPNGLDLSSFKEKEILFLEAAFIQGANVMMNHMKD